TAVVVPAGCIGLSVELERVLIGDRDARGRIVAKQRLLECLAGGLPAQLQYARFQQIADQEFL
ncbi:hypothetical protein, partial [Stenotrophomonas sp.]|uniref:hypothetical protein n=1 Tax=Stenotrophomonas sp. TaxID=69392 RepID=UPI0025DE0D24